jgi:hypothetical protein
MSWTAFICIRLLPLLIVAALTITPSGAATATRRRRWRRQLVNDRLVLNYDRIDGAVAEVLIGAPRPVLTKIAQSKTRSGGRPR